MDEKISDVINTIKEFIININTRIDDICNRYKAEGSFDDNRIINLVEDLNVLLEGIDTIKGIYTFIDLNEFRDKLDTLLKAYEMRDFALFADILQFEVKDLLEYWKDNMTN